MPQVGAGLSHLRRLPGHTTIPDPSSIEEKGSLDPDPAPQAMSFSLSRVSLIAAFCSVLTSTIGARG